MKKILQLLKAKPMALIASLPINSPDLAQAAQDGGADALKVHINIHHQASGTDFGSFAEEKKQLEKILSRVTIPVGIVPGNQNMALPEDMQQVADLGFDFFDVLYRDMEEWLWDINKMTKMVAVNEKFSIDRLLTLESRGAEILEAAIVPHKNYGERLTIGDLHNYIAIASLLSIPVVVPTQKAIKPDEIHSIWDSGVKGIMIGAIVTGKTPASLKKATQEFRREIDELQI